MERKLTAILCADVCGYSRLMGRDEEATLRTLSSHRKIVDYLIEEHRGRFVNSAGDSVLAEFASVVNAVHCAVEIQRRLKTENEHLPDEQRMEFRIGVNLGDVMTEGEQIYGDGVNVAARLESLADAGGVCISGTVHDQVRDRLAFEYQDLGEQTVKNIARPVRVWRLQPIGADAEPRVNKHWSSRYWKGGVASLAGVGIVVLTIGLYQHLSLTPPSSRASVPQRQPVQSSINFPSIAVLPFVNISGDPRQDYFSDGITDELITKLSRLSHLLVIARTSSFTYKNQPKRVQEIGRELNVRYLLEGSVSKSSDQVRVATRLVEANTGGELWAARFDRPMNDLFAVQDDIIEKIVTTLKLQVSLSERGVLLRQTTDNLDAYDDVLRGLAYSWRETKEDDAKAVALYEKAIELDPNYTDAYVLLSAAKFDDWIWQWTEDPQALEHSYQLAQKALALDDSNPTAHVILGRLMAQNRQFDAAVSETNRGLTLSPNASSNSFCLASGDSDWAADTMNWSGKPTEALAIAQQAMRLDPKNADFHLMQVGLAYYYMGRPKDAVPALKQFLDSYPGFVTARYFLAASYVELGRIPEARAEAATLMSHNPGFSLEAGLLRDVNRSDRLIADLHQAGLK